MKLSKSKLEQALSLLAKDAKVLVPMEVNGIDKFAPWGSEDRLALDIVNTKLPPKDALFPQTQKMFNYKIDLDNTTINEIVQSDKQVIFGMRSCDVYSIDCMDKVFLTKGYVDNFYARKREGVTIIAIGCTKSSQTCFCDSMGLNPNQALNADVQLNDLGDSWLVTSQSAKGEEVLKIWGDLLENSEDSIAAAITCELKVDMAGLPEKLLKMFESSVWNDISDPCIGCGTCTYICPTCYCYDINIEKHGQQGSEFRTWDSCMFSEYTQMAGGHNPRPSKRERLRNRFMHKLAYFHDRYGQLLCAGCGRCISNCPVYIDISLFIDKVKEASA